MNDTRSLKKEKNQHIQVFVRVRPINNNEKVGKSFSAVELPSNKEVVIHERPQDKHSKKFTFDKVFGPTSKQIDVYKAVVSPLLEEVLAGYNCTVFAYGQTGTGKTFTMEGVSNDPTLHWQSDTTAGIIPRALSHLFDELRLLEVQEYTVRVSFLELYNEELFDLLSPNDDASKIRLYEDATRKGAVIIHGLEEVTVHNKNEVYKILEKGSERRQTAATLMNAHSSRSHTVFSITIHIKENNVDGEELLKTGKLNLVDLAGSENVGRESKLTRLLQESLGGRTKTSIIATVSPASINLEETLSTLDYAHRAKNITNRPEINQKLSKKALLKEYTEEIERLRRDLLASRERNGVYLAQENYNEMQTLIENQTKEIEEKITHIKVLQETMEAKEQIFNDLQEKHVEQTTHLHKTKEELESTTHALVSTNALLKMTEREKEEQCHLVEKHVSTEEELLSQAQTLLNIADTTTSDVHKLHDKILRKRQLEQENEHLSHHFRSNVARQFQDMENSVKTHTQNFLQFCALLKNNIDVQMKQFKEDTDAMIDHMSNDIINKEQFAVDEFTKNLDNSYKDYQQWLNAELGRSSDTTDRECKFLNETSLKVSSKIKDMMQTTNVEIAKNLRQLNDNVSQKINNLKMYTNDSIRQLCNYKLEERDNLYKNITEIRQNVQTVREKDDKIMVEQERFKKSFENLWLQFNKLSENVTENYSTACATLSRVNDVCDSTNNDILSNYNKFVEKNENLQQKIQSDIETLKSDAESELEKNWTLAGQSAVESCNLANDIQTDLNNHCNELAQNKLCVENDMKQMQQKFTEDNSSSVGSVKTIYNILIQGNNDHMKLMKELKKKNLEASVKVGDQIKSQSESLSDWNDVATMELQSIQERVGKFLVEDLRRDTPTGFTPARKEYQYPRNLAVTSPHERIIHRFRQTRNYLDNSDDEGTILVNNNSPKKQCPNANK
ncbi:hypothetical protein DMN91_001846 [Ooceraea biroi]|uniref:Kinesin-like protein n=1 Tax=Ooceraea biroi TaxID=2015173 RepID=A0A3L8E0H9_OOCBI|nr:hypothetical protein DMN91_001846 [Ooceraea biroi]